MQIQDKKTDELNYCEGVVDEINKLECTDFEGVPGHAEPNDVVFKSRSGKYPDRGVQVVTAPKGLLHLRIDNQNVERFGTALKNCLEKHGLVEGLVLTISAAPQTVLHGAKTKDVEAVCRLIVSRYEEKGSFRLTADELDRVAPEATSAVEALSVLALPGLKEVSLDLMATFGGSVPPDDRWIMEAIECKCKKYGGMEAVRDIILVIGSPLFVDSRQIAYFRAAHPDPSALPFSQIWLSTWRGPTRLKP